MPLVTHARWWACACWLALSWATPCLAYEKQRLAIELLVARDEVPGYACVVHENGAKSGGMALPALAAHSAQAPFSLARTPEGTYVVQAQLGPARAQEDVNKDVNTRAFRALAQTELAATCSGGSCKAVLDPIEEPDLRVTCAANAAGDAQRVLLLRLRLPGDREGEVFSVGLDGTIVSINGQWGAQERPTANVIGGHYFRGDAASARMDNRMQLRIQALCMRRELRLPPTVRAQLGAASQGTASWEVAVDPKGGDFAGLYERVGAQCRKQACGQTQADGCVTDSLTVMLARDPDQTRVSAVLRLPPAAQAAYDVPLVARWEQDDVPNPLIFKAYAARFSWRARCELPGAESTVAYGCPRADLVEAGVVCSAGKLVAAEPSALCSYECKAPPGAAAFSLPLTVRFAAGDQEDAWREQLSHLDQTLAGFTPESVRRFSIAVPAQARSPRGLGDALERLRIWTPSGLEYEFSIEEPSAQWPVLTIPGGQCGSPLRYRYWGTREFHESLAIISQGRIVMPAPSQSAVRWTWGALLAPGLTFTAVDARVDQPPVNLALSAMLGTRYQPIGGSFASGFSLEGALSFLLTRSPYYALDLPDSLTDPHARDAPTWRVGGELAVVRALPRFWSFSDGVGVGAVLGAGVRLPAYAVDAKALGSAQPYLSLGALFRSRVGGPLWIELAAHYYVFERTKRFSSGTLHDKTLEVDDSYTHTLLISFGPRFWL